ncbi:MAG TPA: SIS domain-containing protein [Candidatus Aquilonibacter sp.]|nr:SIS domain-containing protein [Candidatus Aquilonibacter sp.]
MADFKQLDRSFEELLQDRAAIFSPEHYSADVARIVDSLTDCLSSGNRIYWCGNGGSAAEASHLAAEFTGRFLREREGLPSEALAANLSTVTAIGNDFGFDFIFSRQIEAMGKPGDVVVALTTSGKSPNIVEAFKAAKARNMTSVLLSGNGGGPALEFADIAIVGPTSYSAVVQELHLILGHIICDLVEQRMMAKAGVAG